LSVVKIQIIDLGINNIKSIVEAFKKNLECEVAVRSSVSECRPSGLTVLPGIGKFGKASHALNKLGFDEYLQKTAESGAHLLGICLGMHLLGDSSEESLGFRGLSLISGHSSLLPFRNSERLPNIGWNETQSVANGNRFHSLNDNKDFYFVHSYFFNPNNPIDELCRSNYGDFSFASGILSKNVLGFQFHPEKSSKVGAKLLKEIVSWANE